MFLVYYGVVLYYILAMGRKKYVKQFGVVILWIGWSSMLVTDSRNIILILLDSSNDS